LRDEEKNLGRALKEEENLVEPRQKQFPELDLGKDFIMF
jgi:hypothetical protein